MNIVWDDLLQPRDEVLSLFHSIELAEVAKLPFIYNGTHNISLSIGLIAHRSTYTVRLTM